MSLNKLNFKNLSTNILSLVVSFYSLQSLCYTTNANLDSQFASKINSAINRSIKEWESLWLLQNTRSTEYLNKTLGPIQSDEKKKELREWTMQLHEAGMFECPNTITKTQPNPNSDLNSKSSTITQSKSQSNSDKRSLPSLFQTYSVEDFCAHKKEILEKSSLHLFALSMDLPDEVVFKTNDPSVIQMIQDFVLNIKVYDREMGPDDIFQASRNIWISAVLQKLLNVKVELNSALFGYSMLYPYTDNVFDDPKLNKKDKMKFATKFGQMLNEENVAIESIQEQKVLNMVQRMYNDYPSTSYPDVKQAILSIYYGQIESMKQRDPSKTPEEILWISSFKGGTSVLADSFLAKGNLSEAEFNLSFDFGFLLQMVDDLQDLSKDQDPEFNSYTVFHNPKLTKKTRGELALRLINYSNLIYSRLGKLYPGSKEFSETMHHFTKLLILESIAKQQDLFESDLVETIDQRSPIEMDYLKRAEIEKNLYRVMNQIELPRQAK